MENQDKNENPEEVKRKLNYDKIYKLLILIPTALLILSLVYIFVFYQKNGDIINKDISLSGGTSITVYSKVNIDNLRIKLSENYADFNLREISDLRTGEQIAFIIEVADESENVKKFLENYLSFQLSEENSSMEFTGSSIGTTFYKQLRLAVIVAFILMSLSIFLTFRTFVPSFAVILAVFADITMSLALVNFLGIKVSGAGIVAFLMLIGYSVDSDILLTTRVLKKRDEPVNARIYSAFKTGIVMTLTSLTAVIVSLIIVFKISETLRQIFTILTIGLIFDIINTWLTNASLIKWYAEKEGI